MINELICVILRHKWFTDSRRFFQKVTVHDQSGLVEVEYKICHRCGREEMQKMTFVKYDD